MKMTDGLGLGDQGGELAHGGTHQAGLETGWSRPSRRRVSALGDEGGDGVDDDHVDGARADQRIGDFKRLLAGVGLRNEQVVEVHAEFVGVVGIERVLGVDEGGERRPFSGLRR